MYQASFHHVKVCATPFFLTKKFIVFVFDLLEKKLKKLSEIYLKYAFIKKK